ncbi:MAG TPA: polysaccharide deacetylase family protein [Terracidiphilus sp.]|jgi:peptidoglycan/xylan/chitin deacetylase (PgdA/CDA1 family)|nr:polysaccharide deacetylase family protein [Terracidiphilus sp.]
MDFRLDRLATLYLVSPLRRFLSDRGSSIPILMYHNISEDDESGVHGYYRTTTSPRVFAQQMEYLHQEGYQTYSLAQAVAQLGVETGSVAKNVVITFDDGYRDFYRNAFPALSRFGQTATMFLPTAYIGERSLEFKGKECMTWPEVRELQRYGILFGSHTVNHPQLSSLDRGTIEMELSVSKKTIEEKTGFAVDSFAYPYAFPQSNRDFRDMLRNLLDGAGYRNGVCTMVGRVGRQSEPLFMERLPINGLDDRALFQAKLAGGYDWVMWPQSASKVFHATIQGIYRRN